MIRNRILF